MLIELDIPDETIRKLKAFAVLNGGSQNLTATLIGMIDTTVTDQIVKAIRPGEVLTAGMQYATIPAQIQPVTRMPHYSQVQENQPHQYDDDVSGISDGLGDEDDSSSQSEDPMKTKKGGLRDSDLEDDMKVEDPEHEVKVDASGVSFSSDKASEDIFAEVANLPPPPKPAREQRRKKVLSTKAKVSEFIGNESME